MRVIVFAGPTIKVEEIREVFASRPAIDVRCRPPAAQGDVYRAALMRPDAIALIDGYFEAQPAVWHKEILWAMHQGIHVFGAASMGALRAAELVAFGMRGVGAIFEDFHAGILEDDDEVAVVHGPAEMGYLEVSVAMVNIRASLKQALSEGVISDTAAADAERVAKSLFYADRSYPVLLATLPQLAPLGPWLPAHAVNQKRIDAHRMLVELSALLASNPGPHQPAFVFQETLWWRVLQEDEGAAMTESEQASLHDGNDAIPASRGQASRRALVWWLAERLALERAQAVTALEQMQAANSFCARHKLQDDGALEEWLRRRNCTRNELDRMLELAALEERSYVEARVALRSMTQFYDRWRREDPVPARPSDGSASP